MKNNLIMPGEESQVLYWTSRWGISKSELYEAILETGSIGVKEIKSYLLKKHRKFSPSGFWQYIRLMA